MKNSSIKNAVKIFRPLLIFSNFLIISFSKENLRTNFLNFCYFLAFSLVLSKKIWLVFIRFIIICECMTKLKSYWLCIFREARRSKHHRKLEYWFPLPSKAAVLKKAGNYIAGRTKNNGSKANSKKTKQAEEVPRKILSGLILYISSWKKGLISLQ